MSIFVNGKTLRAVWDDNPSWLLTLTVRNFNVVISEDSESRSSVHACLSESLVSDYQSRIYGQAGIDFLDFFGSDFECFFPVVPKSRRYRPSHLNDFAQSFSKETRRTITVVHQQGGDPDTAIYNTLGYWRGGVDACKVFLGAIESLVRALHPHLADDDLKRLAMAFAYLGSKHHWDAFESQGRLYVYGRLLTKKYLKMFREQGALGVRALIVKAEGVLMTQFSEFRNMPSGTASTYFF